VPENKRNKDFISFRVGEDVKDTFTRKLGSERRKIADVLLPAVLEYNRGVARTSLTASGTKQLPSPGIHAEDPAKPAPEIQEWIILIETAACVESPFGKSMLRSAKQLLREIAELAQSETEQDEASAGDTRRRDYEEVTNPQPTGSRDQRAMPRRRKGAR
jgi:hypothetical protein